MGEKKSKKKPQEVSYLIYTLIHHVFYVFLNYKQFETKETIPLSF